MIRKPKSDQRNAKASNCSRRAFTLLETIIALGVFATVVIVMVSLLSATARQVAEARDMRIAQGLADALRIRLQSLAVQRGFDVLANSAAVAGAPPESGMCLTADRNGLEIEPLSTHPNRDDYFLLEIQRFGSGPLAYRTDALHAAFNVRVSWPYRAAPSDLTLTPRDARRELSFATFIMR